MDYSKKLLLLLINYYHCLFFLAEVVARVQALRLNQNPKDDAIIREKVSDTARLVRDVHQRYLKKNVVR